MIKRLDNKKDATYASVARNELENKEINLTFHILTFPFSFRSLWVTVKTW